MSSGIIQPAGSRRTNSQLPSVVWFGLTITNATAPSLLFQLGTVIQLCRAELVRKYEDDGLLCFRVDSVRSGLLVAVRLQTG